MKYKILIKTNVNTYNYAQEKYELTEKKVVTVEGVDTIEEVGTGVFKLRDFETDSIDKLKEKYIELLEDHKKDNLDCVADVSEKVTVSVDIETIVTKLENGDPND